ncbi:MAG: Fic family protein, partial [Pseudomonadota bacterium]
MTAVEDRGESVGLMEPMRMPEGGPKAEKLTDLAVDLAEASAKLSRSLPVPIVVALADLVRSMNCYYSNLIEGHDTHPIDIDRALKQDYSRDPKKRNLQIEALAHIDVQRWIDLGGMTGPATDTTTVLEIHRRFCEALPDDFLFTEHPGSSNRIKVVPGALRKNDVKVGRHLPVSPGAISRFMARFEAAYRNLGRTQALIAAAAAHHRLLWIHPFLDGNGRVARLMSHAMLSNALTTGGIWSVARGLARNDTDYKLHLMAC